MVLSIGTFKRERGELRKLHVDGNASESGFFRIAQLVLVNKPPKSLGFPSSHVFVLP
jgi:hypothetical protein